MAWKVYSNSNESGKRNEAVISLRRSAIAFSAGFVRLAELKLGGKVLVHVDEEERKIGFEILKSDLKSVEGAFTVSADGGGHANTKGGKAIQTQRLMKDHAWVAAVANSKNANQRKFVAEKLGKLWVISLRPAFEKSVKRSGKIEKGSGIYRYLRNGETVYIGKGVISERQKSAERENWDFDVIEFSHVSDDAHCFELESYWINEHKKETGKLPLYNRISGKKTKS